MGSRKVTSMKGSNERPGYPPRLITNDGELVEGQIPQPEAGPSVDVYAPLRLVASNGVRIGEGSVEQPALRLVASNGERVDREPIR